MIAAAMGWIGTVGTIGAYVMLSRGSWTSSSLRYAALNCAGGVLGAVASSVYGAWPSVASNVIWSGVAAQSILVTVRDRRAGARTPVVALAPEPEPVPERDWVTDTLPLVLDFGSEEHWVDPDAATPVAVPFAAPGSRRGGRNLSVFPDEYACRGSLRRTVGPLM